MKPIEFNSVLTFLFCFGILIMLFLIVAYYFAQWKIRLLKQEQEYKTMYSDIQKHIAKYPVDLSSYYEIKKELWRLTNLKWKDNEMTAVLILEFYTSRFLNITIAEREKRNLKK